MYNGMIRIMHEHGLFVATLQAIDIVSKWPTKLTPSSIAYSPAHLHMHKSTDILDTGQSI